MPVTRLLALSVLLIACTGFAFAQSQQNASNLVVFQGAASMNVVDGPAVDQSAASPDTQSELRAESNQDSDSPTLIPGERWHSHSIDVLARRDSDWTCLFIRDYRVVRDSPHSDSTHRDGYTTCVPAARFRMYTTLEQGR
jgi:hypothetical protein